jgi:excisionase family DNA binding protein
MTAKENIKRPTNKDQKTALESYNTLISALQKTSSDYPEIEIEDSEEKIKVPRRALEFLAQILKETSKGKPISIVPIATELTTQAAAEVIGCSRPHLIKLLEKGEIKFTKVGKHRRIKYRDVVAYKHKVKEEQRRLLSEIMKADEDSGLYDS